MKIFPGLQKKDKSISCQPKESRKGMGWSIPSATEDPITTKAGSESLPQRVLSFEANGALDFSGNRASGNG
jgi:hypothetical protein